MGSGIAKQKVTNDSKSTDKFPIQFSHVIGKGGFAVVYKAYHLKEKKIYAIKETNFSRIESQSSELEMALTELEALKVAGSHPFLVKLHSAFREGPCSYLVLDPLLGGDLRYHLRNFQLFREQHVAYFVACIGSALHHLHERGILHRDVKPENVMLGATGVPYLTDFGTAYVECAKGRVPLCSSSSGTLPYLSPESLTFSRRHSHQNDFWSLGVLAYELLFNLRPFEKHCPTDYIYFSDNQYRLMWDHIAALNSNSSSSIPLDSSPNNLEAVLEASSSSSSPSTIMSSSPSAVPPFVPFDFEAVTSSLDENLRLSSLPYPQYHIPLTGDGEVPPELLVHIPLYTFAGELLSPECRAMLTGLLDVRIPFRLGNMHRFSDFSDHPWLLTCDCLPSMLRLLIPPFVPNLDQIRQMTHLKFCHYPPSYNRRHSNPPYILPKIVEEQLSRYNYFPQEFLALRENDPGTRKSLRRELTSPSLQDTETSNSVGFHSRSRSRISLRSLKSTIGPVPS
jgi:serine/threonine protein kinase